MLLTPGKSEQFQQRLRVAVEAALKRKGVSARKASLAVVGNDGLVRDIRAGVLPSADRIQALFEYLGAEYPIGQTREPPPIQHIQVDGAAYTRVPLHEAWLSAGPGNVNGDVEIIEHLAFRQDWLARVGVSAQNAALARISGESMAPGIQPGDIVLIDASRLAVPVKRRTKGNPPPPIYAFVQDGEARVKRIERPETSMLVLLSDNPTFPPELVVDPPSDTFKILGQVVWSGHTYKE